MKNCLLFFLVLFLDRFTWVFQLPVDKKDAEAVVSPVSGSGSPVSNSHIPPFSSLMTAFSPEIVENDSVAADRELGTDRIMFDALIIASASVGALMLSLLCLWFYHKKISDRTIKMIARGPGRINSMKTRARRGPVAEFDYKILESATDNFHQSNVLGEGGLGCVYKARLDDGCYVAVKKVDAGGQDAEREFENELDLLIKVKHANIISLLGYCIYGETRFLVFELMEKGSLETQLHGPSRGSALTWHVRVKIALDVARGLEYLHEHCKPSVIHGDLKSSTVLLDANFNAKLSGFGFGSENKSKINLSSTSGYVAPEYLLDGKMTDRSDVYAFGVVLLELLLGHKPLENLSRAQRPSIVTWAMPHLTDRSRLLNIVDPALKDSMDLKHLYQNDKSPPPPNVLTFLTRLCYEDRQLCLQVAAVAVLCVQPEPSYRPLITDVLHSLVPLVPVELGGSLKASHHPSVSHV